MTKKNELKKLARKAPAVPSKENPVAELKVLVSQHRAMTKARVALINMSKDKKIKETGETLKCRLPEDVQVDMQETAKRIKDRESKIVSAMTRQLKQIPIYDVFLRHVGGCGPVVAAYLCAEVDITLATKPSSLRLFCGMAVENGTISRRTAGVKNRYNSEIRVRLYQMFGALWKMRASHKTLKATGERLLMDKNAPYGKTSRYLDVWENYKHRAQHNGRIVDGKIVNAANKTVSAKGFVHSTGWHKAADVFLADLYTVWRSLEGLPVWPTYVDWIRGYKHGGLPLEPEQDFNRGMNAPRLLTLEEALSEVGDAGMVPRTQAIDGGVVVAEENEGEDDDDSEDEVDAAAE